MIINDAALTGARTPSSARAFGLTFASVLFFIMVIQFFSNGQLNIGLLVVAIALVIVSLIRPSLLEPANKLWLLLGRALHKVSSIIILGAMFSLIIVPIALVLRVLRNDRLALKRVPSTRSYWMPRDPDAQNIDFDRPF